MTGPRTFALIPAAGTSSRMGRPKLLLPLGNRTVLERVVGAFRAAGVEEVLVVLAPGAGRLAELARNSGGRVLEMAGQTPDMRATIEHGLDWIKHSLRPSAEDAWLVSPADHPTLNSGIIAQLLRARQAEPRYSIVRPVFEGKRGHPALIGWGHVAGIRALPAGEGLNVYLRRHAPETLEVPADSADVLCDLDTPEDYERLLQRPW